MSESKTNDDALWTGVGMILFGLFLLWSWATYDLGSVVFDLVIAGAVFVAVKGNLDAIPVNIEQTQRAMLDREIAILETDEHADTEKLRDKHEARIKRAQATRDEQTSGTGTVAGVLAIASIVYPPVGWWSLGLMTVGFIFRRR